MTKLNSVANRGSAMELKSILKNGASLKSHKIRKNFKRFSLFALMALFGFNTSAQDVITLKNGDDIRSFVQEIGETEVKYKKFENPNGPNYTLKKSEILIIRYANGSKDIFADETKPVEKKDIPISVPQNNDAAETVYLPENQQNRKDVIILDDDFIGFQTEIIRSDHKYVYCIKYKRYGKEK